MSVDISATLSDDGIPIDVPMMTNRNSIQVEDVDEMSSRIRVRSTGDISLSSEDGECLYDLYAISVCIF